MCYFRVHVLNNKKGSLSIYTVSFNNNFRKKISHYFKEYLKKKILIERRNNRDNDYEFRNRYESLLWAAMGFPSNTCRPPCTNRLIDKIGLSLGERKIRADRA